MSSIEEVVWSPIESSEVSRVEGVSLVIFVEKVQAYRYIYICIYICIPVMCLCFSLPM